MKPNKIKTASVTKIRIIKLINNHYNVFLCTSNSHIFIIRRFLKDYVRLCGDKLIRHRCFYYNKSMVNLFAI
jgi:hypothetical protein